MINNILIIGLKQCSVRTFCTLARYQSVIPYKFRTCKPTLADFYTSILCNCRYESTQTVNKDVNWNDDIEDSVWESDTNYEEPKSYSHSPVMLTEVVQALDPLDSQVFIDMTFGAGGHTKELLKSAKDVKVFALDRDAVAFGKAEELSESYSGQLHPLLGHFSDLQSLLSSAGVQHNSVDGIMFDLGCSSMQFDDPRRGFALSKSGPLDMRMDGNRIPNQPTAADVINNLHFLDLARIFKYYGDEKKAKMIAQGIIDARNMLKTINTTKELADLVAGILEDDTRRDKLRRKAHVATKIFQALRIFTNNELNELNYGLTLAHKYLKPGGRLVALSFHSLEDRIVKRHILGVDMDEVITPSLTMKFRNSGSWHSADVMKEAMRKLWQPLYKKVILPSVEEVERNPRSRSCKLRAAVKL